MFIGIDLGTTYSVGAYIDEKGEAKAVPNSESEMITPSVVYIENADSIVVGQMAKENCCIHPDNVISLVKNSMGKRNPDGTPIIFHTDFGDYTPEVISSFILKKITSDCNAFLNPPEPITDVVVTKPAYFTEEQVKATENAVKIAGLNCLGLLNEPTAAALYYASKSNIQSGNIMVYDLGGGTFDVTIIHINGGSVEVKATDGLNKVGGSYFDREIVQNICADFENKYGIDLNGKEYADVLQELYTKVEKAKLKLSSARSASIIIRAGSVSETIEYTRDKFEEIVAKLYKKTQIKIQKVLKDAGMSVEDIDKVILAGGSSRIPYVEEQLKEFMGKEPSREVNPNEVVALGAAIYGKQLTGKAERKIVDVCSHGIGIRAKDANTGEEYNDIIIRKNTPLPVSIERAYLTAKDDQEKIGINVFEGDYREITDVSEICDVRVELPGRLSRGTKVYIRIEMDKAQLLHIFLRIPEAGNIETEITFNQKSNLTEAQVSEWKKRVTKAVDSIDEKNGIKPRGMLAGVFGGLKKQDDASLPADKKAEAAGGTVKSSGMVKEKTDKSKDIPKIILNTMEDIIGMDEVKAGLRDYRNRFEMSQKKSAFANQDDTDKCIAILGKSGMGITTAAAKAAECLYKFGAVSEEKTVWAGLEDILGPDEQTMTENIRTVFQNAMNGVLIFDEFESFYDSNEDAVGMKAMNYILKAYQSANNQIVMIISGDNERIKKLFDLKPKFARLFYTFTIEMMGYTSQEYVSILHRIAERRGYVIDDRADSGLAKHFQGESKLPDFSYIHYLEKLLQTAVTDVANKATAKRHAKDTDYSIIRFENFLISGDARSLDELLDELNGLTGLAMVKQQVNDIVNSIRVINRAKEEGMSMNDDMGNLHMAFMGNAGTGKTTVARIIGAIFRELGVLQRGHMVEVTRKDLVSEYVGQTAKLVGEKVNEAMGGILFIDEAYSLCRDSNDAYGQEAVDALVPLLENYRRDFICIIAGYTSDIKEFLRKNQGLESRFPNKIMFEDYSLEDMVSILNRYISKDKYILEGRADDAVRALLQEKMRDPGFGNARGVRNVYDEIRKAQRSRISKLSDWGNNEFNIIRREDIRIDDAPENEVDTLLGEINSMIGLAQVKQQVNSLVNMAKVDAMRKKQGQDAGGHGTLHMVFTGNPGTGKTTVARKIGKIYKALGLLTKGDTIEVTRSDLVAGYVGQTAGKTGSVIRNAIGSVLFIDEAYTLNNGDGNDFGKEAINQLVADIENYRDNLVVIIAGYTQDMKDFLAVNPGLASRFPNTVEFEDYSIDEMVKIWELNMKDYTYDDEVLAGVRKIIEKESGRKDFGNARGVRNITDSIKMNQNNRLAAMMADNRMPSPEESMRITAEDVTGNAGMQPGAGESAERTVETVLAELDALTGLNSVKAQVHALVNKVRMNEIRRQRGLPVSGESTLHMVFTGNPGTGKTTVARKIGEIYHLLGLLSDGGTIETGRSDLVAGYVGQTAGKVDALIKRSIGNVLFIDEAYTLSRGGENDFGKEAIDALVAAIENNRNNLAVIIAGYTGEMQDFMDVNPGLASRFPNVIVFEDYTVDEMMEIFDGMMKQYHISDEAEEKARELIIAESGRKDFANARGVRNIKERIVQNQDNRMSALLEAGRELTDDEILTILPEDVY